MENDTLFYIFGGALTVAAFVVSLIGLRSRSFPPSGAVMGGVVVLFAVLVAGTAVYAVASARDEQAHREAEEGEHAEEAAAEAEDAAPGEPSAGGGPALAVQADPEGDLAFAQDELSSKAGSVTIDFDNPAPVPHNVAIRRGSEQIATTETITASQASVTAELQPGEYEFVCTVPGHEEAGMVGTLTVE